MTSRIMRAATSAWASVFALILLVVLLPNVSFAQSSIAGTVRDTTGAVLPGVTVEATSPVLIEKVRTVHTDEGGLYRVLDLRPGVYTVTFTLSGFTTVRRESIDLPTSFTATLNVEMPVGGVAETVSVTGGAPTVDTQNVLQQRVLSSEVLENIPSNSRTPQAFILLTPGVTNVRLGTIPGSVAELGASLHGAIGGESLITIDGDRAVSGGAGGGNQPLRFNEAYVQEMSVRTGAASAEQEVSGIVANIIPKEGGNAWSGSFYTGFTDARLQGDNLTQRLKDQGLRDVSRIVRNHDETFSLGGPVFRDRVWFFTSGRSANSRQTVAGLYLDTDPNDWLYTPDFSKPAIDEVKYPDANARLTWQMNRPNKVGIFVQRSGYGQVGRGLSGQNIAPAASRIANYIPNLFGQVIWKYTRTSRLLLEAGYSTFYVDREQRPFPYVPPGAISAIEVAGQFPGIAFRAPPASLDDAISANLYQKQRDTKASATYVTGAHSIKAGLTLRTTWDLSTAKAGGDMQFTLRNGSPISIMQTATPWARIQEIKPNLGLFAQDQWTVRRLTLNAGVRFDYFRARTTETHLPAVRWVPARDFPAVENVPNWKDINPRLGVAYDLFGTGTTALKASLNRYVNGEATETAAANHPLTRSVVRVTRNWTDGNGDFIPDCDLNNPLANSGVYDTCGIISNLNFGLNNPNATTYADDVLRGRGVRGYNWTGSAEVQQHLFARTSMTFGYYRRWAGNFQATDNLSVTPADYDPFCVTAPVDTRLPDGGGYQICGLYDVAPAKAGQVVNRVVQAAVFGKRTQIYDGFDLTTSARFPNGAVINGGLNTGRTATNTCFVVDSPQALLNCDITPPFQSNIKIFGIYPVPLWGVQASAVLQIIPGPEITANYVASNAEVVPTLKRNLASGANGTVNVPLIKPGTLFADNSKQLDVRFTKHFRFDRTRIEANVDIFNIVNGSGVQVHNVNFGTGWLGPRQLQLPRYVMFSIQLNF
jgi:Carboxypeptidase regulatory-like domain